MIASPMLGRPEAVDARPGRHGHRRPGGKRDALPALFDAIGRRTFEAGADPTAAAAIKIANNFVLGCAIEAMGEGFSLVRKYGVVPDVFYDVMTDGLFASPAYKVYGKIIVEQRYLPAGQRAISWPEGCQSRARSPASAVGVPLPSGNVWRDRLVGAVAHGEGERDWAVMAQDQARASGLAMSLDREQGTYQRLAKSDHACATRVLQPKRHRFAER